MCPWRISKRCTRHSRNMGSADLVRAAQCLPFCLHINLSLIGLSADGIPFNDDKLGRVSSMKRAFKVLMISILASGLVLGSTGMAASKCPACPPDNPNRGKVVLTCFYLENNPECARTISLLKAVVANAGHLELVTRDMALPEVREIRETLDIVYEVRKDDMMRVPAVFMGKDVFIGYEAIKEGLRPLIMSQQDKAPGISGRLKSFARSLKLSSILASERLIAPIVIAAGLVDGINPCALSLLLFLVACLSLAVSDRRPILITGISFVGGAFVAYFAIGLGILRIVQSRYFDAISDWLYPLLGVATLMLGCLSLFDFYKAWSGRAWAMKLQLPPRLKKLSRSLVHGYATSEKANAITGFSLGFLASLIEFPCTGQVYLPTLALIGNPPGSPGPLIYLILYNILFVVPLALVVVASALLLPARKVAGLFSKRLAAIKLLTAFIFFALSAYMFGLL